MKIKPDNFINNILQIFFKPTVVEQVFNSSFLIQYLYKKTKSVGRSSKSRSSFANIYAIYVLVADYIDIISKKRKYNTYKGMQFSKALKSIRSLPWGEKLQNHAINHRLNEEFKKFFGSKTKEVPVIRDPKTRRYWFNEKLLLIKIDGKEINISDVVIRIIDQYITLKQKGFQEFINRCQKHKKDFDNNKTYGFIDSIISEETDARLFEIVSYCILKQYYESKKFTLYKTGRTNANDGGIDFVLKPQGRFFQVTEVFNFEKYFLDIEKLLHYPITFVIRTELSPSKAFEKIKKDAKGKHSKVVLKRYLNCFEEIITLPALREYLSSLKDRKEIKKLLEELIVQYQVEYNIKD